METILSNFYAMEEHRRKVREAEALKFKKANEDLRKSFYRHTPTPYTTSHTSIIEHMYRNLAIHDEMFSQIMESEYESSSSSYTSESVSCSSDTSSSDNSSSGSDSSSCSPSSSYD